MSKIYAVKVLQLKWFLFTSKFLYTFKLLISKIAKTDMRNIKFTLELFINIAGNIYKKNYMKSLKFKSNVRQKTLKK